MAFFKKEITSLFPEGRPLSSKTWTGNDLITNALKANVKDIMTVKLGRERSEKIEKEGRKQRPPLKIFSFNGHICYLIKDEKSVYDLVQMIDQQTASAEVYSRTIKQNALDQQISFAEKNTVSDYQTTTGFIEKNQVNPMYEPMTDVEIRWSEEQLTEQLRESETEIQAAETLLNLESVNDEKPKKKRKNLGRTNRIQIRLTDAELTQFRIRVEKSGLSQGEFLRNAALHEQIVIEEYDSLGIMIMDELAKVRAELGRQGGLLKMITKPNRGQRELAPEEWKMLMAFIRDNEKMKEKILKMEEKLNGNSKTSIQ